MNIADGNDDVSTMSGNPDVGDDLTSPSSSTWHQVVVSVLCGIGAIGNALTVVVLSRQRGVRQARNDQKTAAYCGMVAMAFADTMFCLSLLPRGFIPDGSLAFVNGRPRLQLAYQLYSTGFVTTSALLGSWFVVATAGIRYIGICHPFRARALVNFRSTKLTILLITAACIVGNLPSFWFYDIIFLPLTLPPSSTLSVEVVTGSNGSVSSQTGNDRSFGDEPEPDVLHVLDLGLFSYRTSAGYAFLWLRGIFGLFIPLVLLVFFNVNLISALRMSEQFTTKHTRSQVDGQTRIPRRDSGDGLGPFRRSKSETHTGCTVSSACECPHCKRNLNTTTSPANQPLQWCCHRQSAMDVSGAVAPSSLRVSNWMKITNRHRGKSTAANHWLTSVLVLSVLFFVVLVFPSDLLDFASHLYTVVGGSNRESLIAARPVTNLLQVID